MTDRTRDFTVDEDYVASATGAVALGLPLYVLYGYLRTGCFRDSLSHAYYAPVLGQVFVGALFVIGALMLAYRPNEARDRVLLACAGLAAFAVAVFPTAGPGLARDGCPDRPFVDAATAGPHDLHAWAMWIHFGAAAVLFAFLAFVVWVRFRRPDPCDRVIPSDDTSPLLPEKRTRNAIYATASVMMIGAMGALGLNAALGGDDAEWRRLNATFWLEAAILAAFGTAWLVRGRVFRTALMDPAQRTAATADSHVRLLVGGAAVVAALVTAFELSHAGS